MLFRYLTECNTQLYFISLLTFVKLLFPPSYFLISPLSPHLSVPSVHLLACCNPIWLFDWTKIPSFFFFFFDASLAKRQIPPMNSVFPGSLAILSCFDIFSVSLDYKVLQDSTSYCRKGVGRVPLPTRPHWHKAQCLCFWEAPRKINVWRS